MRFDSIEHVIEFNKTGRYPKIHQPVFDILPDVAGMTAIDLGSCFGLISRRLVDVGCKQVLSLEGNTSYLNKAIRHPQIKWLEYYITRANLNRFRADLTGVNIVIARRVFPEISESENVAFVEELSTVLAEKGVKYILIEGRKKTKHPVNKLFSAQQEAQCFQKDYRVQKIEKDCILLINRKH